MTRRPRRDRPPRLPDRPADRPASTPRAPRRPSTPSASRQLLQAGVCGSHPRLGREEVLAAARRLVGPGASPTEDAVTIDEVTAALEAVAGPQGRRRGEIDPERTLAAARTAGDQLAEAARRHRRVAFATAAPASLLSVYTAAARAGRAGGAVVADAGACGPYASGRSLWWHDGVAVATDGQTLVDETRPEAGEEWLFVVGRPALVVADGVFAEHAIAAGLPTVAFADLDAPAPALAAHRGRPVVVVPVALRRPPAAYAPIARLLVGPVLESGPVTHDGDGTRHGPQLSTETPGPYAAPPSGGEG